MSGLQPNARLPSLKGLVPHFVMVGCRSNNDFSHSLAGTKQLCYCSMQVFSAMDGNNVLFSV